MQITSHVLRSFILAAFIAQPLLGQSDAAHPPVIDIHYHGTATPAPALSRADSFNVRYRMIVAPARLARCVAIGRPRASPPFGAPCADHGRAPFGGDPCLSTPTDFPDTAWLRAEIKRGRVRAFGELIPQYVGMSPADPRLDPYWSMAEEFDLPVGIHMGTGPQGAAYMTTPFQFPKYRAAYNDPMLLEEVLMRHKKLRLVVMHAGWPLLDQMISLLYAHPGVSVDVGVVATADARAACRVLSTSARIGRRGLCEADHVRVGHAGGIGWPGHRRSPRGRLPHQRTEVGHPLRQRDALLTTS